jgi:hypothetical protein
MQKTVKGAKLAGISLHKMKDSSELRLICKAYDFNRIDPCYLKADVFHYIHSGYFIVRPFRNPKYSRTVWQSSKYSIYDKSG